MMKGAGLTVGGFYAHFTSKVHLATEALRRAFEKNRGALFVDLDGLSRDKRYDLIVRRYLSRSHRDMKEETCPVPACLSEIDPGSTELRDALIDGLEEVVTRLIPLFEDEPDLTARQRALATLGLFVGALSLARATRGRDWSDEMLLAARKLLFRLEGG